MNGGANFWRPIFRQMRRALDFRLVLFWLVASMVPTLLVGLPLAGILRDVLDFSAYSDALAQRLNLDALSAIGARYQRSELAIQTNVTLAWVCTLLFAPMLTALAAALFVASEKLPWSRLFIAGLMDYSRWFWLHLSALLVYLLGFGMAAVVAASAEIRVEEYVDANSFANVQIVSWLAAVLIALITHFFVEIARAEYLLDCRLRFPPSAFLRALSRGQLLRRISGYLIVGGVGISALLLLLLLRQRISGVGVVAMLCTVVLAQCSVAAIAWMRTARFFVLAQMAEPMAFKQVPSVKNSSGSSNIGARE